jgi:Uma2 family endonuclease
MPQPELLMFIEGGKAQTSSDDYVEGGPEFVAEVASSTKSIDLGQKYRLYQDNQVQEYLVWRVDDQAIDWFVLRQGQFARLAPNANGIYHSEVFPGLWLNVPALLRGDMPDVFQVLQQGIATPEHAAFVARLRPAAPLPPA